MAKLVEILARRLLAWPEHAAIAVQDKDRELKFSEVGGAFLEGDSGIWIRDGSLGFREDGRIDDLAEDQATAIVTRAEWQAAVDALNAKMAKSESLVDDYVESQAERYAKEWDGVGLPPVGTVCEFKIPEEFDQASPWRSELRSGHVVEIVHHYDTGISKCAVFKFKVDFGHLVEQATADCFRPVRTPEQIAAEEREAEVNRMVATVSMLDKGWARKVCYALYDNNYRKQEPK